MKLREWINRNSALVTVFSVFLLVYALIYLLAHAPTQFVPITKAYYYDIQTGQLFEGGVQEIPPIGTPDGSTKNGMPAGVRANVFTCTDCNDPNARYIGFLETYTPEAQEAQLQLQEIASRNIEVNDSDPNAQTAPDTNEVDLMDTVAKGRLIASPDDLENWFTMETEEGAKLANNAMKKCPDEKYPIQCFPKE